MQLRAVAITLALALVSSAFAAIPPLVSGQEYTFDGYLVIKARMPKGFAVILSAHPNGEHPPGLAGRQDFELTAGKVTAAKLLSTAKSVGGDRKVTVKGHGGPKSTLKVESINPFMPRVQPRPAPRRMVKLRVEDVRVEKKKLLVTVMPNPCTPDKDIEIKTSAPAETDPVQATLWLEEPQKECMLAVMPSPKTITIDLAKQFPGVKRLALSVESRDGQTWDVDWQK
jgi:hypothetical protein